MKHKIIFFLLTSLLACSLAGCAKEGEDGATGYPDENGYAQGHPGDAMHSIFFDYTVNSAYLCDSYENYTPQDGYELLVADITVQNTFEDTITMYDGDFQVQWGAGGADVFDYPVTCYLGEGESIGDKALPSEYELAQKESRTGLLVFEVPAGETSFSISYTEYFDDDTTGNTFSVSFEASKQ